MTRHKQKQTIRHCMVVHNYYPFAETRVQRQAEALVNNGYEVDVVCLRHSDEPTVEKVAGVTVHRVPMQRSKSGPLVQFFEYLTFLIVAFFKLTGLHLRKRYHVVQVHNLPDFLVFVALIPKLTGSRVILDIHDLMPEFYCAKFNSAMNSLPVRLIRWQEWLSCRFADHIITVTESWRQTLIKRSVSLDKCTVVMNVADPHHFNGSVVTEPPHENDTFRMIYHGTLTPRYGIDLVLHALAQIRADLPDARLTVHGRGEYLKTVLEVIEALNLQEIVDISTEFLSIAELSKLIASCHVGLVPYRRDIFTDGILPTKLMEYTLLGVPAIAARTPAILDYFDDTMIEFFIPEDVDDLAHHIRILYRDRTRLSELASNTAKFNKQYNWSNQAAIYSRLVEKLGHQ